MLVRSLQHDSCSDEGHNRLITLQQADMGQRCLTAEQSLTDAEWGGHSAAADQESTCVMGLVEGVQEACDVVLFESSSDRSRVVV